MCRSILIIRNARDGIDGPWSSLFVHVGSPKQDFRVLVSLAAGQTWLVVPPGCPSNYPYAGANCASSRGGLFNTSTSKTWNSDAFGTPGIYTLGNLIGDDVGFSLDNGQFGFDNVSLSYQSGTIALNHTVVAGIGTPDYWLGQFGISPHPFNVTDLNNPIPSYFKTLQTNGLIPSLTYSFNAGSYFRKATVKSPFMSLIFGGFDASRFVPNDVRFTFGSDTGRELVVGIQSITGSSAGSSNTTLLKNGILARLDSSQSYIWLPNSTCLLFEQAFGLIWDDKTQLYLVNDTLHQSLITANPSVTFRLGNGITGSPTVDITLPYGAFDLTVSPPLVSGTTSRRYFPLKRAANDSQYILGRAFLQEAYITVDYERGRFNVSQALWNDNAPADVQAIASVASAGSASGSGSTDTSSNSSGGSSGLSTGSIAGIAVGGAIIILTLIALFFILRRRKAKKQNPYPTDGLQEMDSAAAMPKELDDKPADDSEKKRMSELADTKRPLSELEAEYMRQDHFNVKIDEIVEMEGGADGAQEMESPYEGRHEMESPVPPEATPPEVHELDGGVIRHWGI